MTSTPLLALSGIDKRYPTGTEALRGLDLTIERHGFVSLLGASGCGKSTVLRLLSGLERPTGGQLVREQALETPGEVGFVFQHPTLMPWARVAENVSLPMRLKRRPAAEIEAAVGPALDAVGLREFAQAYPRELSGGMQMRAAIARALITRPQLLLLDEPFAALDEITRFRLAQDLRELWAGEQFTAVFVTHSVYEAVFLSERIVVMSPRPGRVAEIIDVKLPGARDAAVRQTPEFAVMCTRVSQALARASGEPVRADTALHGS